MEDDEENLCSFGTPLEPLEEDEIPSKKPIAIEDQIVTDSNGRRRFHGAFTGGFSAGFWNTVGSLEGWKPQSFKSSRSEKARQLEQKPIDFMDDEDLGEFGIAPQRIQTTEDFTPQDAKDTSIRKRKLQQQVTGPIPGIPVLHQLLKPAKENVAIRLLKKMGWKFGQGIGARQTRKEKKATSERNARERYVMKKYGCDLGPLTQPAKSESEISEESSVDDEEEEITFAPDDFDPYVCTIKNNTFGLGYSGLNPNSLSDEPQHVNLFGNAFEVVGKNNKKLSIRGQAFGVGALEEEDEDIYALDDMTKYDFSLESKKKTKPRREQKKQEICIDGFCSSKQDSSSNKKIFIVTLQSGFKPRNWAIRKSRFEPISEERMQLLKQKDEYKTKGLGRHDLDPIQRGNILGESVRDKTYLEKVNEKYETEGIKKTEEENKLANDDTENVIDDETRKENEKIQMEAKKITQKVSTPGVGIFRPFLGNEEKQERYDKFLEANLTDDNEIIKFLTSIQPLSMSDWDREMEKKEFLQARNIYRPLKGLMSDRFVSESTALAEREEEKITPVKEKKIVIKRTVVTWKPCSQLCKRFNVAEPFGGTMVEEKKTKKPRFSVFDYLESSINRKDNFITPVIIPTKVEKPMPIIPQNNDSNRSQQSSNSVSANSTVTSQSISKDLIEDEANILESKSLKESDISENMDAGKLEKSVKSKIESREKFRKPKTELEKKIEETKNKHPSEKKDIFKLIFESSSEEESDSEEKTEQKEDENKDVVKQYEEPSASASGNISKVIYATLTKSATEINILRNTSPPRGIFANLFTRKSETTISSSLGEQKQKEVVKKSDENSQSLDAAEIQKISETQSVARERNESENDDDQLYGPKLPTNIEVFKSGNCDSIPTVSNSSTQLDSVDKKLLNMFSKSKGRSSSDSKSKIVEKWVEKSDTQEDKKKKKKKDKKHKNKKHKKDKKSKK